MRAAILIAALALSACAHPDASPAIEVRTVTVDRPVAVPCFKGPLPDEPPKVADKLTGDAVRDLDMVAASAIRLRAYADELRAILTGCVQH